MKIRINTDITFKWRLLMSDEEVNWKDYDLSIEMFTPSHKKEAIDFTVDGTELEFTYKPNQVGQYIISAFINRYKEDEAAVDVKLLALIISATVTP